jgi:APA family basic amino acid/polyamine antiporter
VLGKLSSVHPVSGGLYVYSKELLSPFWGFVSGWGYFIGTAAGNALIIHAFRNLAVELGFSFGLQGLWVDVIFIVFFTFLSLFNVEIMGVAQSFFTLLKTIPFFAVIVGALYLFKTENIVGTIPSFSSFTSGFPIVLFAYIGIEACCSIGHVIEDGKKNTSRVLLIALGLIIALYTIIQFLIIGIHGTIYANPFTTILQKITTNPFIIGYGNKVIEIAILSSYLGGFYSMFYANSWNLFAMAEEQTLPFSKQLTKLNNYKMPWLCVATQAALVIFFLTLTTQMNVLMVMSDFGIAVAYILSTLSFLVLMRSTKASYTTGILALGACSYLLYVCFTDLASAGLVLLVPYLVLLVLGLASYKVMIRKQLP